MNCRCVVPPWNHAWEMEFTTRLIAMGVFRALFWWGEVSE